MGRFLVDESLPRAVTRALEAAGHDVVDVRDIGLRGASDDAIAARANVEARLVVTADLDFSNALRFPPGSHVARIPDTIPPGEVGGRVAAAIGAAGSELDGAIAIIEPTRVRIFKRGP